MLSSEFCSFMSHLASIRGSVDPAILAAWRIGALATGTEDEQETTEKTEAALRLPLLLPLNPGSFPLRVFRGFAKITAQSKNHGIHGIHGKGKPAGDRSSFQREDGGETDLTTDYADDADEIRGQSSEG